MSNKYLDLRSPRTKAKQAAWRALPAAIIHRPLQYIGGETNKLVDDVATGGRRVELSPEYLAAKEAAKHGDGATVKNIARRVALGV